MTVRNRLVKRPQASRPFAAPLEVKAAAAAMLALLAASSLGCMGGSYYASDLPPELQAPVLSNSGNIDLASFAKPTSAEDLVTPGDVLEVSISTGLEERYAPTWTLRVDDNGAVTVPLVGPVRLGGLALSDADRAIYDASVQRGIFRHPNVSVTRKGRRENRIVVAGAVRKPGAYELPVSSSDVLSALVAAGGLSGDADTLVEIRQPGRPDPRDQHRSGPQFASQRQIVGDDGGGQVYQLDLAQTQYIENRDVRLGDGAVVTVRQRPEHVVAVMGLVNKPGQFDMPKDGEMHLLDAVARAGGRSMQLADKVYVVRQSSAGAEPVLIRGSIRDAKDNPEANIRLAPGDVVSLEETPMTMGIASLKSFIRLSLTSRYALF